MPPNSFVAYLCYDPRDPAQRLENSDTWKRSTNSVLIAATMLYVSRESFPVSWDKVAALADLSEEPEFQIAEMPSRRPATFDETKAMLRNALAKQQSDFA
jgi:hypothetical protein